MKKKRFIRRGNFFVNETGKKIQAIVSYGDHNKFFNKDGNLDIKFSLDPTTPGLICHFDYNVYSKVVEQEEDELNNFANEIRQDKENIDKIIIIGHASLPGDEDYNDNLGLNRGIYIANKIKDEGINILSISNGEHNPIIEDNTVGSNAKNQRTEVIIIKSQ